MSYKNMLKLKHKQKYTKAKSSDSKSGCIRVSEFFDLELNSNHDPSVFNNFMLLKMCFILCKFDLPANACKT